MHDDITDVRLLWSQLTPAERSCVLEYHTCGVKVKAARRAGKNQKWLEYHQKAHPLSVRPWTSVGRGRATS